MDLDELQKQDYEVIADKTLSNQDHLFKLIIIGDTGKLQIWERIFEFQTHHFNDL